MLFNYLEYSFPNLISAYQTPLARLEDFAVSIPFSVILCVLIMKTVLSAYEAEQRRLAKAKGELEASISEIRVLRGLLPMCAACKKIRTEEGAWTQIEVYIERHSHASFTHGLCPGVCRSI